MYVEVYLHPIKGLLNKRNESHNNQDISKIVLLKQLYIYSIGTGLFVPFYNLPCLTQRQNAILDLLGHRHR